MLIKPNWRILTIGDGDLSFSWSLWQHHKPSKLWATVFDSKAALADKYELTWFDALSATPGCRVLTQVDITQPCSWQNLPHYSFDLVVFQFPLVPALNDSETFLQLGQKLSINTLNRALLRTFLLHTKQYLLDPDGLQLAYISSKSVKPYQDWNLERAINQGVAMNYLGSMPFNFADFPGYQMRNVDRPGWVKQTAARTYVWSGKAHSQFSAPLEPAGFEGPAYCEVCRRGPFSHYQDRLAHEQTKRHLQLVEFERQWQLYLKTT